MKVFYLGHPERGFEGVYLVWGVATAILIGIILVPALLTRIESDREIQMKALLRNFYEANEVYRNHHPEQGYAETISSLVYNAEKIPYLAIEWLKPLIHGYRVEYLRVQGALPAMMYALKVDRQSMLFGPRRSFCVDQRGIIRRQEVRGGPLTMLATPEGCAGGIEVV